MISQREEKKRGIFIIRKRGAYSLRIFLKYFIHLTYDIKYLYWFYDYITNDHSRLLILKIKCYFILETFDQSKTVTKTIF